MNNIKPSYVIGALFASASLLALVMIIVIAVTVGGDDDNQIVGQASPTPPTLASVTVTTSATGGVTSPTPLSTLSAAQPTSTPLQFATSAPPPTQLIIPTSQQPQTTAIGLTSPNPGSTLRGNVTITGSASHPNFVQYALEYGPDPNPSNLWYPITIVPITRTVVNNALGAWNTTSVADGRYQIRLHVWLNNGVEDFRVVTGLQVQNRQIPPTSVTNNNPLISPVGNIEITQGKAVTIALGMTDIDNDPLTYLAQVANPSVATVQPSGTSAITISGLNVGTTNVTITINDGRGGTASTSFAVSVKAPVQPNNPPSIAPIPAQSLNTGQTLNLSVVVSDPDQGDTITLATNSTASNVASTSLTGNTLTISGNNQGSASINVTATDSKGLNTTVSFSVTVTNPAPANRPPAFQGISNQTVDTNATKDVALSVSDPDSDPLTLDATSSNNGVVSAVIVGNTVVRISGVAGGSATITVKADDKKGGTATTSFAVTVNPPPSPNKPPTIQNIPAQTVDTGQSKTVDVVTSDPEGNPVTLSVAANPQGIATVTVAASKITIDGVSAGSTTVTVTASDGTNSTNTTFSITVNAAAPVNTPPTIDTIQPQTVEANKSINVGVTTNDADGDSVTITTNSANPGIATVSTNGTNTVTVTGVAVGDAQITVTASDGTDSTELIFTVTVGQAVPVNSPPTITQIQPQSVNAGSAVDVSVITNDADGDPVNLTVASADSNIATVTTDGVSVVSVTGVAQGSTQITVTADDGTDSVDTTFDVTVNPAPPSNTPPTIAQIQPQSVNEGSSINVNISTNDADGNPVSISVQPADTNIATASTDGISIVNITGVAQGTTQITVTADDGTDSVDTTFDVTVNPPANNPPTIAQIAPQAVTQGSSIDVNVSASDPDGDPLNIGASAVDSNIASVSTNGTVLTITGSNQGTTQITVTVSDGTDSVDTTFDVTVNPPANNPPTVAQIAPQAVTQGSSIDVNVSASDPDGDPLNIGASAVDSNIASVSTNGTVLTITGSNQGTTQITVTVSDGTDSVDTTFDVTVNPPANNPPTIAQIAPQSVTVGNSVDVLVSTGDPDGNPVNISAQSANEGIATIFTNGFDTVSVTGVSQGMTQITVTAFDGTDSASTTFDITVNAPANNPPTIQGIGDQTCNVGDVPNLPLSYDDLDGDPITVIPSSTDDGIASVSLLDQVTIGVNCNAEGAASITIGVDDGRGGTNSTTFNVTVNPAGPPPPAFDVTQYAEIPDMNPLLGALQPVYNNGQNAGNRNTVFSVAGDDPVNSGNFLDGFATGSYDLGNFASLDGLITFYNAQAAHDSVGDAATSFNVQSAATGDGWTIEHLFNANFSPGYCNGAAPLQCELTVARPAVIIVSFSPTNATATPTDIFQADLQAVVSTALSAGTIPVLTTLPDDGSVDAATLAAYNEIIVNVASNANVPLWNVYNTMQGASSGVYGVGNGNPFDLTDAALTGGANRRNLAALQVLQAVKQALFP